jgi:hypothetical protein
MNADRETNRGGRKAPGESKETPRRCVTGTGTEQTADACWDAFQKSVSDTILSPVVENGVSGACASQIVEQQAFGAAKTPFAPVAQVDRAWDF